MNSDNTTESFTEDEVRAFGDELNSFAQQLSPRNRLLLAEILRRATSEGEVSGYYYQPPPTTIAPVTGGVLVLPPVNVDTFPFGDATQQVFQVEHRRPLGSG